MKRFWCYLRLKTKLLKRTLWSASLAIAKVVWVALPVLFLTGGTFFAYAGWVLDHPDRHGWLVGLIGAAEVQLLKSYDVLRSRGKITASAPGFDHIVRVLFQESEVRYQLEKRFLPGEPMSYEALEEFNSGHLIVHSVASKGWDYSFKIGGQGVGMPRLLGVQLEFSFLDLKEKTSDPLDVNDIQLKLVDTFLEPRIYSWAHLFFLLGIAMLGFSGIVGTAKSRLRAM